MCSGSNIWADEKKFKQHFNYSANRGQNKVKENIFGTILNIQNLRFVKYTNCFGFLSKEKIMKEIRVTQESKEKVI